MQRTLLLFGLVLVTLGGSLADAAERAPLPLSRWPAGQWESGGLAASAAGEGASLAYTVGQAPDEWPGAQRTLATAADWSSYARLEFDVRVRSPRTGLPARALSVLLGKPGGARWQQDTLPHAPQVDAWVAEAIDLGQLPQGFAEAVAYLQFFVWNRDYHGAGYQAGDAVVFEVRNLRLTGRRLKVARSRLNAPPLQRILSEKGGLAIWSEPPDTKVLPEAKRPGRVTGARGVVDLEAAANETVDFQVALRSEERRFRVGIEVGLPCAASRTAPASPFTAQCLKVRPVGWVRTKQPSGAHIRAGLCPDPLLEPGAIDLQPEETRAFWVRLRVPRGTAAGLYQGEITLRTPTALLATARYRLRVYPFALPDESHLPTAFQFLPDKGWSGFQRYYPEVSFDLFRRFWESMAEHRVAPMHLGPAGPPRPADEKALGEFGRYVDLARELRFNAFGPYFWGPAVETEADRSWVRQMADYYQRKGVLDRTYVYMCQFDEAGRERWPAAAAYARALKAAEPRLARFLTVAPDPALHGAIDIWCPGTPFYDRKVADERRRLGEKVWWYTAVQWTPGLLLDAPGAEHRALIWLSWTQRVDGLLFWCINYWPKNPWEEPQMGSGTAGNGDGFLLYPRREGDPPDRFYESVRWEILRDSLEDFEYLWLLRDRLSRAEKAAKPNRRAIAKARAALATVEKVATDRFQYSLAPEDYAQARRRIAEAIVSLGTTPAR